MDQNSLSQMESKTQIYEVLPQNYINQTPIQIYEVLRANPNLITFNVYAYKNGLKPIVPIQPLGKLVGSGSYGQVYKVQHDTQKFECALKIMSKCELEGIYILVKEFQIQQHIGEHYPQCIIQLRDKIAISQQQLNEYTIQAYLDIAEYSLWEIIQKKKLSETEINEIFDQILDSILNLHSLNISHGDIKPQNILFEKEKGWVLADFGCAIRYSQPFGKYILGGTKAFFPLDLRQKIQNLENLEQNQLFLNLFIKDIYAFQLTILILLYPEKTIIQLQKILDCKQPIHQLVDSLYNKNYITLKQWFKSRKYQRKNQETKELMQINQINQLKKRMSLDQESQAKPDEILNKVQRGGFVESYSLLQFELVTQSDQQFKYNINKQLDLCKGLQFMKSDKTLQFYQAKLEFVLGNFSNSKQIMNNLNDFDYMENDEQFLQFQILKARLNGTWWKISDKIIDSIQNIIKLEKYHEESRQILEWECLLMGQLKEKLHIKNKRKNSKNFTQSTQLNRVIYVNKFIDHCWEVKIYYNLFLESFGSPKHATQIIEENFPNYYFNWMIYYLDAVYNIIKDKHQEAKSSALKAFRYIKDESCIVNKFRIQFLLWITYLNLEEVDDCNKTFTYILNQAQLQDAPQLFKEYFSYFSEELLSDKTISRSIGFFKDILEKIFLTQENLINDNELNLFFFQMLSKYYIFEQNPAKLQKLINSSLISFYQNNSNQDQTVVGIFDYMVFSDWQVSQENITIPFTKWQKLIQMKCIFSNLDIRKMDNQIAIEQQGFFTNLSAPSGLKYFHMNLPCSIHLLNLQSFKKYCGIQQSSEYINKINYFA